jgi:hypothetical protein
MTYKSIGNQLLAAKPLESLFNRSVFKMLIEICCKLRNSPKPTYNEAHFICKVSNFLSLLEFDILQFRISET